MAKAVIMVLWYDVLCQERVFCIDWWLLLHLRFEGYSADIAPNEQEDVSLILIHSIFNSDYHVMPCNIDTSEDDWREENLLLIKQNCLDSL